MEKLTILGKEYIPKYPKEFPVDDFNSFIEIHKDNPFDDFFEMMEHFQAVLFMKNNKDLFVKMMVEDLIEHWWIAQWMNRNIPLNEQG